MSTAKCKSCGSCGMPMEKPSDFALGNPQAAYCCYCTDKQGKLFPYDQILKANAGYYVESQGVSAEAATKMAAEMLASQPAWAGRN